MSNSLMLRWIVLCVCLFGAAESFAQQTLSRHNWYFGNTNRGIRFSRSDNSPSLVTNKAIPFNTGGSAVASDPTNANLLFYTDGTRILDVTHAQMPNGGGIISQSSANQPIAITGRPGFPNQYYVFTNDASFTTGGTIRVTTVDMAASGNEIFPEPPIGNVTTKNVGITLTGRSEAMITVPHGNGTSYWLITHENGLDNFTATLIDGTGVFTTATISPNITGLPMSAANFSYHAATGKIAVSPQSDNRNVVILNFDNNTGAITLDRFVLTSGVASTGNQAIYDTEWNASGRFLYISTHGDVGIDADVLQFDMTAPAGTSLVSVLDNDPFRSYGLQIAPDSAIYHLYQATSGGPFLVGRLTDIDSVGVNVTHTQDVFGGNFNGRQFPAFLPRANANLIVSFTTQGTCANTPISFFPTVAPTADSLVWDFGDSESSSDWSPIHAYDNGGGFNATVTAYLNGQSATFSAPVNVLNFTLQLTLPQDTTACRCEFPPPVGTGCNGGPFSVTVRTEGGTAPLTFTWSNGDTGATLTPDSAGYYYVVVTDATGCSTYAGVNVREYDATEQRANIWYFGQNAGIDFNVQPAVPITGPINTPEGVSVISDRNGEVIFSTDGVRVYDKNDVEITTTLVGGVPTPIVIPPGIGGEQGATQSALIFPVDGDETLYYIFTTQQVHGTNTYQLRYSLYDIKLNNGDGGLVEYNKLLFARSTERITGNNRWLIAHEYGNNSFRAYEVTTAGIGNPVISSLGSDHLVTEELNGQGYMKLGGADMIAVALSTSPTSNFIEVFDFVDSLGTVTNFRSVNLNTTQGQVYGVEIVGPKILATIKGSPTSFLREAYIDFQNNPVLITPAAASGPFTGELGAIQRGPDGTVYVAINNSNALGVLAVNGDTLQLSTLNVNGFPLAGGTQSRLGLPNFVQQVFSGTPGPSMSITNLCGGSPTIFQGTGTDAIDVFFWTFGDGFTADSANVEHTYPIPAAGTTQNYTVTLRITNRCGLDTLLTQTITISGPPPDPTFLAPGDQPVLCNGPVALQALPANDPDLTYLWSTSETTFSIEVARQGLVGLTITNTAGCTSSGDILITDNRPVVELGPDQTVCQNTPVAPLNAFNPTLNRQWVITQLPGGPEVPSGTGQTQNVNTSTPGEFEYRVEVTDPVTTCSVRDSVVFTINPSPAFTAIPNTILCGTNNGEIALTITAPVGNNFSYLVSGLTSGITRNGIDQSNGPVVPFPIAGLPVDTYVIEVEDQISGCATTQSVGINSTTLSISNLVAQTPTCDPVALEFDASVATGTYRVINSTTGVVVINTTAFTTTHVVTAPVPVPGDYIVEIRQGACISTAPITVVSDPQVPVNLTADACANPVTLTETAAPPGSSYTWAGPGVVNVNAANTTATPLTQGLQTYTVTVTNPGFCANTRSITINVTNNAVVDFVVPDPCTNSITLAATVTPAGSYTYRWYRNGAIIIPSGQSIVVSTATHTPGDTYRVEAVNSISGCVVTSATKPVNVFGTITASMTATSPCPDDLPFSIEASSSDPAATFEWYFNGSRIVGQSGSTLPNLFQQGEYSVIAVSPNNCRSPEVFGTVTFQVDPDGGLPATRFICNQTGNRDCLNPTPNSCVFQLEAQSGMSWQWYQDGNLLIGQTNRTLTVSEPGLYTVEILHPSLCTTTDQTEVIEQCQPILDVPNAFRPGSGIDINKTFSIFPSFVSESGFQIFIYNRWGEMVYQSNKLDFTWDGTYKGNKSQLLPAGTYTYVIRYSGSQLTKGNQKELRGGVMLLR